MKRNWIYKPFNPVSVVLGVFFRCFTDRIHITRAAFGPIYAQGNLHCRLLGYLCMLLHL